MRVLTAETWSWGVWKNVESALTGYSDIDAVADPTEHVAIRQRFAEWAGKSDLLPVVVCPHLPGSTLLVAPAEDGRLVELHLMHRAILRGAPLFEAAQLQPMMIQDPRGFRKLRAGSEGMLLFFHNGVTKAGSPNPDALKKKGILAMIQGDPEGAAAAAPVFGAAARHATRATSEAGNGGWSRRSVLLVQATLILRSLRTPSLLASRIVFRMAGAARCPVLAALQAGRRVNSDPGEWLQKARRSGHLVLEPSNGRSGGSSSSSSSQ